MPGSSSRVRWTEVHRHQIVDRLLRHGGDGPGPSHPGVDHQDIDRTGLGRERGGVTREVGGHDPAAGDGGHGVEPGAVPSRQYQARVGHRMCGRRPDAGGGAGDQYPAVVESHGRIVPRSAATLTGRLTRG
jgi:hypothetical protein